MTTNFKGVGLGTVGATGALAPGVLKLRGGAKVSFRPRNNMPSLSADYTGLVLHNMTAGELGRVLRPGL